MNLRVRRATILDLPVLRPLWISMHLPADELESRLTEFQVVERDGEVAGAIGFQIQRTAGRLHNEAYADFSIADATRQLFWERIQTIAANHGVFRLWTQENSPFWLRWGFQPANSEILSRLPPEWSQIEGRWFTQQLKDEDAINAALKNKFAGFMDTEKEQTARLAAHGQTLKKLIIVAGFGIFFICLAIAGYLLFHRHGFTPSAE